MKARILVGFITFAIFPLLLTGCDDGYSEAVRYNVRTDPILMNKPGDEYDHPDQPGQLPILVPANFLDIRNPLHKKQAEKDLVQSGMFRDPSQLGGADRETIRKTLDKLFGTPARPTVAELDESARDLLKLSDTMLVQGSKSYRVNCLHCHGVTGDGRGPTARWVNPHPRDYRQGMFKFTSVDQIKTSSSPTGSRPPLREDLLRILEIGVEGTAMPSFVVLPAEEREALISYVIHLSLRGKTEYDVLRNLFNFEQGKLVFNQQGQQLEELITEYFKLNASYWMDAQNLAIQVPEHKIGDLKNTSELNSLKESVERGLSYFSGKYAGAEKEVGKDACVTCHRDFGRQATFRHDEYGTLTRPNNFTLGVLRGGRRPADIYRRIHSGISPSGMIAFGKVLPQDKMLDLVNLVQVLGNPSMRKTLGIQID